MQYRCEVCEEVVGIRVSVLKRGVKVIHSKCWENNIIFLIDLTDYPALNKKMANELETEMKGQVA